MSHTDNRWLSIRAGDRVRHARRGQGLVLSLAPGGKAKVRLDGDPGLPWTLPLVELLPLAPKVEEPAEPRPAPRPVSGPSMEGLAVPELITDLAETNSLQRAELRQTIEAMRLGVVPAEHVRDYTVGRDDTLQAIEEMLEVGGGMRVLWGDYGTGKTHMLDITERVALERGFLTSRIVLDPNEVPPSHPRRLYTAVVDRLRYPDDQGTGLEPLFQKLVGSREHTQRDGHAYSRFYSPYLFAAQQDDADLVDWMRDYVDGCNMDVGDGNARLLRQGWNGRTGSDHVGLSHLWSHVHAPAGERGGVGQRCGLSRTVPAV